MKHHEPILNIESGLPIILRDGLFVGDMSHKHLKLLSLWLRDVLVLKKIE